jgi:hypothetical protein
MMPSLLFAGRLVMEIWRFKSVDWDENNNYIEYNITGQRFKQLMDLCFGCADCFSMREAPWTYARDKRLALALREFRIREIRADRWFCNRMTEPSMKINLYQATEGAKETVLCFVDNLFLDSGDPKFFSSLEDLCFFKGNDLFFGTVSHEKMCYAHILTADFARQLNCLGEWENGADNALAHLSLSDF